MIVKCPRCRHENPAETKFCGLCGAPLDPAFLPTETLQSPPLELETGTLFAGRYRVVEELGRGGMGRVYKVQDAELNEKIALKLLRPELAADAETVERFRNELKSARAVVHKNVCRMFDFGRAEGAPFITMEYVAGEDLKRLVRKIGQLPAGRAVSIAHQIADGLAEAHARGIVHRDLKPQNIMVDEGGSVRIMDFGIARSLDRKGLTGAGVMIGTPEYMSPEQVEGKAVDARSDIYALGVILYEMTTGRVPFEGDTPFTVGVKHKSEIPKDPREYAAAMPDDLAVLILRCLEKDKDRRFESAAALGAELGRIEQALPTTERIVPKRRAHTSKQVTVTFDVKKVAVPAVAAVLVVATALVLFLVVLNKHVAVSSTGKPLLAVLYFKNNTGDTGLDEWRTALPTLIIADLYQSRYLDVVSESQIYGALRELNLLEAPAYAPVDLKRVAEKTYATHVLQGTLTRAGTSFRINTTLEDAATGKVLGAESVQGEGEASFHTMVDELGRKIKAGLQLTSREIAEDVDKDVGKITSASPDAYKLYAQGRVYHMDKDYKSSIALMEKAVAIDPGFAMAYRSLSAAYSNMGFRAKADDCIRKALSLADRISDRERWLVEGSFYYRSEKTYDRAIEAFNKVLALYPNDPTANNGLGLVYGYIDEPERSLSYYEACVRQPGAPYLYYGNLVSCLSRLGRYGEARQVLEDYLETSPDSATVHDDLAGLYMFEGRYDLALAEAEKAFALAPTNTTIWWTAGEIAMLEGDFARAEQEFQKAAAAALQEKMPWRISPLLCLEMAQGKFWNALEHVSFISGEAGKVGEPAWLGEFNFFAAFVYNSAGRRAEAFEAAVQSCRMAEARGNIGMLRNALFAKGTALVGLNDLDRAQKAADEGRELVEKYLNKKSIRGYQNLQAQIDLARVDVRGAIENAKAAVDSLESQSNYSNPDAYYLETLAVAYEAAGDLASARAVYEGIQKLTRGRIYGMQIYALSFYHVGLIDEKLGDKAGARRAYEKFLDLWKDADPDLPEPADARRRLAAL
jgi:serine/threonine protein kinase/tetratricopeptide (TPR) repeat protein